MTLFNQFRSHFYLNGRGGVILERLGLPVLQEDLQHIGHQGHPLGLGGRLEKVTH